MLRVLYISLTLLPLLAACYMSSLWLESAFGLVAQLLFIIPALIMGYIYGGGVEVVWRDLTGDY